jgi:hypothetical protein
MWVWLRWWQWRNGSDNFSPSIPSFWSHFSSELKYRYLSLDGVQSSLDAAGYSLNPIVNIGADAINAGISLFRGNFADASANALGMVPIFGDAAKGSAKAAQAIAKNVSNAGNLKVLSDGRLKSMGVDAHKVKEDILEGPELVRYYNIAIDNDGLAVLVPRIKGSLPNVPSYTHINDFIP